MLTPLEDVEYPVYGGPLDGTSQAVPPGTRWIYVAEELGGPPDQPAVFVVLHAPVPSARHRLIGVYQLRDAVTRSGERTVRWEWFQPERSSRARRSEQADGNSGEVGG